MPAKRDVVNNAIFNEYVYDNIVQSPLEKRRFLNGKLADVVRQTKKSRTFSINSSLEDKILMLAKLGIPCAIVFNCDEEKLKELQEKTKGMSNNKLAETLAKDNVFAICDKQMLMFAGVMASNCHSETALLNRDFLMASFRLNEWRQGIRQSSTKDSKDSITACRDIAKFMYGTIMLSSYAEGFFDVSDMDMCVLLYFLSKEREFISFDELKIAFNGIYRLFKVGSCIKHLVKSNYLQAGAGDYDGKYKLTSWGLDLAMKFQKKVFSTDV